MFDVVCLSSGGLDSTVCLKLFQRDGLRALPVFINYGQRNIAFEFESLEQNCRDHQFHRPVVVDLSGYGAIIRTGLTSADKDVYHDAFTPNRNLLFLTAASGIAHDRGCNKIALGFLTAESAIFPDQTDRFLAMAEDMISESLGVSMSIHAPLRDLSKREVVTLAREIGVVRYYSCHSGGTPCGHCIACLEYEFGES
jgi:7-cyano-7-deazaguanine synthase